jgi:hypothetical protein
MGPSLFLLLVLDERLRGLGDEDLAAAGGGADPGRAVDGQARIGALDGCRLARVNAYPNPDGHPGRPLVAGQRPLHRQRAQNGLLRAPERDEERVALRVDLVASVAGDGRADQPPVVGQHLRVPLPQRLDQPGRALDVTEQEGDRAARKVSHGAGHWHEGMSRRRSIPPDGRPDNGWVICHTRKCALSVALVSIPPPGELGR